MNIQISSYPFRHSVPVQIRFNDIDTLGHVNNSVYFQFFDLGKAQYFNAVKGDNMDWAKVDIVVANVNCNFISPIYFSEDIAVRTQVSEIRNSSFTIVQQLVNVNTSEVKCQCTTIMVGYNIEKRTSKPISQDWIDGLSAFEQRQLKC